MLEEEVKCERGVSVLLARLESLLHLLNRDIYVCWIELFKWNLRAVVSWENIPFEHVETLLKLLLEQNLFLGSKRERVDERFWNFQHLKLSINQVLINFVN